MGVKRVIERRPSPDWHHVCVGVGMLSRDEGGSRWKSGFCNQSHMLGPDSQLLNKQDIDGVKDKHSGHQEDRYWLQTSAKFTGEQNSLLIVFGKLMALSLEESWCCCKTAAFLSASSMAMSLVSVDQETVVLVSAWLKVLCLNKGSWKTPSTQFLRVVTGESCLLSMPVTGEVAAGDGVREEEGGGGGGWHLSIQDGYSVWFRDVAVCAKDQIRGLPSNSWCPGCCCCCCCCCCWL
ncbi:hypothetical protein EYF80_010017 [Liparis tanakae]|uniref:Uncharacterized protein n=1 Tax=Liparis tanakae TaxID=230148 RepID=A0A4Z2IRG6_9TELE|nr:hypothetical protein EYF80_010017 [Liparis tanakae]